VYRCNGPPPVFSPNGRYLATAVDFRLVVRDVDTLNVVHLFSCLDKIQHIEWAADSDYLLCGLYRRAMVQAWSVQQPDWTCKIDEGPAGIAHARWTPDGRQILTYAFPPSSTVTTLRPLLPRSTQAGTANNSWVCRRRQRRPPGGCWQAVVARRPCVAAAAARSTLGSLPPWRALAATDGEATRRGCGGGGGLGRLAAWLISTSA
jgi:hypothetical protein